MLVMMLIKRALEVTMGLMVVCGGYRDSVFDTFPPGLLTRLVRLSVCLSFWYSVRSRNRYID